MGASEELVWLINQLRSAPSPRERLRLLALGWRTLKDLSPADRLRVGRELGMEGAGRLVEELSRRGGASPSRLLGALKAAENADPEELQSMVGSLLDPEGLSKAAGRFADEAVDRMVDDGVLDPAEVVDAVMEAAGPGEPTLSSGDLEVAPPPVDSLEQVAGQGVDDEGEAGGAADAENEVETVPADLPPEELIEQVIPANGGEDPARASILPPPGGAAIASAEDTLRSLAAEMSVIRRLRSLSVAAEDLENVDLEWLRDLLELFPTRWAKRRALDVVFRAGLPMDVKTAVRCVDSLDGPDQRLWALTTLAGTRTLDERGMQDLLDAAGSKLVERRLRLRFRISRRHDVPSKTGDPLFS